MDDSGQAALPIESPWSTEDDHIAQIAARAREYRQGRRLTLQEAAELAGYTKGYLWEFETGKRTNPTLRFLMQLSRVYAMPLAALIGEQAQALTLHPDALQIAVRVDQLLRGER